MPIKMKIKLVVFLMLLCPLTALSQGSVALAERIFESLRQNQTDSIYNYFADALKAQMGRAQMDGVMQQVEEVVGSYQRHGDWQQRQEQDFTVYSSIVDFEHGQLSVVMAFDGDNRLHGLRLMPAGTTSPADDMLLPADAVEVDDTVRTGNDIALPCSVVISGRSEHPSMVVMVHGSGPNDRNETVMSNRPFLDLSRQLAERGISSLRYDKRTFVYKQPVNSMDEETILDAVSAIRLARTYSNKVYLLGHSLGAMLAPIIAQRVPVDGIIMMAGPARDLADVVNDQLNYLSPSETTDEQKQAAKDQMRQQSPHYFEPQHQVEAALQLQIPILLLQGERDYQVPMTEFLLWQQRLEGRRNVELRSFPALNHLFLEGEGPSTPQEYVRKGTIPSAVTDQIATFINRIYIK